MDTEGLAISFTKKQIVLKGSFQTAVSPKMAIFTDSLELDKERTSDTPLDLCYLFAKGRPPVH